jgi:hypothetical protein
LASSRRPHPEERALARVSKDGRESLRCIHPSRRLLRKLLRMRSESFTGSKVVERGWRLADIPPTKDEATRPENALVAPHDIDSLLVAVAAGNGDGLGGAARHVRPVGGDDVRRKSMGPIPGDIIRIGVMDVARWWLRNSAHGFAIRRVVEEAVVRRPEAAAKTPSTVTPEGPGEGRTGHRMRGRGRSPNRAFRPGGRPARGKHQRDRAERGDRCPIHPICHGTYRFVGD